MTDDNKRGGWERTGKKQLVFAFTFWCLPFQSAFAPFSVLFCGIIGLLNFHMICTALGRTKLFIFLKKKPVQSLIYLRQTNVPFVHRFWQSIYSLDKFLLGLFFFWKPCWLSFKIWERKVHYCKSYELCLCPWEIHCLLSHWYIGFLDKVLNNSSSWIFVTTFFFSWNISKTILMRSKIKL